MHKTIIGAPNTWVTGDSKASIVKATSILTIGPLVNEYRTVRVAEVLSDFRTLQYYIAAAPTEPLHAEDYYTEGWAALRQCALDGQHILNCAADVTVPHARGGEEEQSKAELKQCVYTILSAKPTHKQTDTDRTALQSSIRRRCSKT